MAQATKERVVYHVVPNASAEKWVVSQENAEFRREFDTKDEAVEFARERAENPDCFSADSQAFSGKRPQRWRSTVTSTPRPSSRMR